jgi:hypothetical protein
MIYQPPACFRIITHKYIHKSTALCGMSLLLKPSRIERESIYDLQSFWWKYVDCEKCLKMRKK